MSHYVGVTIISIGLFLFSRIEGLTSDISTALPPAEDVAEETQHAICKIITQEVETSANATVTRQLKGVCTTKQMEHKFSQLERKLLAELKNIRELLDIESHKKSADEEVMIPEASHDYSYINYDNSEEYNYKRSAKSDDNEIQNEKSDGSRDEEIGKFNNTVKVVKNEKVYIYYWKIDQIQTVLYKQGIHIRSPDLYVLGHQLCIQLYPNHLGSNYLGIQLRPSSNFFKKHRITILDQLDNSKDINSQIMGGLSKSELMYRVPNEKLQERHYLSSNNLIVKITIFLES